MLSQAGNAPSMKADPLHNCEILFFVYNKVAERALHTAHPFKEDMPVISPGISEKNTVRSVPLITGQSPGIAKEGNGSGT